MWLIMKRKYGLIVKRYAIVDMCICLYFKSYLILSINFRETVQMLVSLLDPEGVERRKGRRLKRRVYQNKVIIIVLKLTLFLDFLAL